MPWHDPTISDIGGCRATPWRGHIGYDLQSLQFFDSKLYIS
jgi:hypothetical protein